MPGVALGIGGGTLLGWAEARRPTTEADANLAEIVTLPAAHGLDEARKVEEKLHVEPVFRKVLPLNFKKLGHGHNHWIPVLGHLLQGDVADAWKSEIVERADPHSDVSAIPVCQ